MTTPPTILLLEDEAAIADTLLFALGREGMAVQWHSLVSAAEAALAAGGVDLAIFDVGLPDGSGLELLRRLRRHSELPVMLLTARADEVDRIVGLELGADDYVVKPFSPREVAARVKGILKRVRVPAAAPREAARFEHDIAGRRISYLGTRLQLTPAEYNVLAVFVAQPGRVFSRAQLLDALGEAAEDSFERTIDSHIKSLRAKLREIAPAQDPIETHRGFGYALSAG